MCMYSAKWIVWMEEWECHAGQKSRKTVEGQTKSRLQMNICTR